MLHSECESGLRGEKEREEGADTSLVCPIFLCAWSSFSAHLMAPRKSALSVLHIKGPNMFAHGSPSWWEIKLYNFSY